jgi:hypothetical protein
MMNSTDDEPLYEDDIEISIDSVTLDSVEPADEPDVVLKPKRVMSEKQLENLKKARVVSQQRLKEKKAITTALKKKEQEVKILTRLDKSIKVDKRLKELKESIGGLQPIVIRQPSVGTKPTVSKLPPVDEKTTVLKPIVLKTKKKRIVYVSASDDESSEEEIVVRKKRTVKTGRTVPSIEELTLKSLDEEATASKQQDDLIIQRQYNERMALIRREYLMSQVFQA